ncbi:hypothetical protein SRHO_G00207650 [Serrasalmus rhombeus]
MAAAARSPCPAYLWAAAGRSLTEKGPRLTFFLLTELAFPSKGPMQGVTQWSRPAQPVHGAEQPWGQIETVAQTTIMRQREDSRQRDPADDFDRTG